MLYVISFAYQKGYHIVVGLTGISCTCCMIFSCRKPANRRLCERRRWRRVTPRLTDWDWLWLLSQSLAGNHDWVTHFLLFQCQYAHLFTGFPRLLENPGKSWIFYSKFQDLESPGKLCVTEISHISSTKFGQLISHGGLGKSSKSPGFFCQ